MSVYNASLLPPHLSNLSNPSPQPPSGCFSYRATFFIFTSFTITNILLLLPPCTFVLYLGLQRWLKKSSGATSHSDIFTYHEVAMQIIGIFGCGFYVCGVYTYVPQLVRTGLLLFSATSNGQTFFHMLTCAERYLAVVFPITYLSLRQRGGVRIRNVTIACVWLILLALLAQNILAFSISNFISFSLSVLSIVVVSFCSASVLYTLIRPGPGDGVGNRDRAKMRGYYTIMAIMVALLFRFGGHLLVLSINATPAVSEEVRCCILVSGVWFCIPCSLVLPLLFLHRAGKLLCSKNNTESSGDSE